MDRFSLRVVSAWGESYHLSVYFIDGHREIKSQTRIYSFAFFIFCCLCFHRECVSALLLWNNGREADDKGQKDTLWQDLNI